MNLRNITLALILAMTMNTTSHAQLNGYLRPVINGEWWDVASTPDLGEYNSENQEPVDFGLWQAADGTWQLWSCIRYTNCGGHTRLFFGWEGENLTDSDWKPMGVKMEADPSLGEAEGGLQAPHVVKFDGLYWMAYGDWNNICFATSKDGKNFERIVQPSGKTALFGEGPGANTRDAMMIKIDNVWHCYYTAILNGQGYGMCRLSSDLKEWGNPSVVSYGGMVGPGPWWNESPHVVEPLPGEFIYFRNQYYGSNHTNWAYYSKNPLNFGINDDTGLVGRYAASAPEVVAQDGQYYIASLKSTLDGIRIAKLDFARYNGLGAPVFDFDKKADREGWKIVSGDLATVFTDQPHTEFKAPSQHVIGTAETVDGGFDDSHKGVIESPTFTLDDEMYILLVGGGSNLDQLYVAVIAEESGQELVRYSGTVTNTVTKRLFFPFEHRGEKAFLRIVDQADGPWSHLNFGGVFKAPKPEPITPIPNY